MIVHVDGFGVVNGANDVVENDVGSDECRVFVVGKLFVNGWELTGGFEMSMTGNVLPIEKEERMIIYILTNWKKCSCMIKILRRDLVCRW